MSSEVVVLHEGQAYDVSITDDTSVIEFKHIVEKITAVPVNLQTYFGISDRNTQDHDKLKAKLTKNPVLLRGKQDPKLLRELPQSTLTMPEITEKLEYYINTVPEGDEIGSARICTLIVQADAILKNKRSLSTPEFRVLLQKAMPLGGVVSSTKIMPLLQNLPGNITDEEFEAFLDNLFDPYEKNGKLDFHAFHQMQLYSTKCPEKFRIEHVDTIFTMDNHSIEILCGALGLEKVLEKKPQIGYHKVSHLVSILRDSIELVRVAASLLLVMCKKNPSILYPYVADVFHGIHGCGEQLARWMYGPQLIAALCYQREDLRQQAIGFFFEGLEECPTMFLLLYVTQIFLLAAGNPSQLRPFGAQIVQLQNSSDPNIKTAADRLCLLAQGKMNQEIQSVSMIVNQAPNSQSNSSVDTDTVLLKLNEAFARLGALEDLTAEAMVQSSKLAQEMNDLEEKVVSWHDSIDLIQAQVNDQQKLSESIQQTVDGQQQKIADVTLELEKQRILIESGFHAMKAYVDQHLKELKLFIGELVKKVPVPVNFTVEGVFRKSLKLHFTCGSKLSAHCKYHNDNFYFTTVTKEWNKWLKVGLSTLMLGLCLISKNPLDAFGFMKYIYDTLNPKEDRDFDTFAQQPFLTSEEQDHMILQLRRADFFRAFSYDPQNAVWICSVCKSDQELSRSIHLGVTVSSSRSDVAITNSEKVDNIPEMHSKNGSAKGQVSDQFADRNSTRDHPVEILASRAPSKVEPAHKDQLQALHLKGQSYIRLFDAEIDIGSLTEISMEKAVLLRSDSHSEIPDPPKISLEKSPSILVEEGIPIVFDRHRAADPADPNVMKLFESSKNGDVDSLKEAIKDGSLDVNLRDESRKTPLHYAVQIENKGVIDVLIKHGAMVSCLDNKNKSPVLQHKVNLDIREYVLMKLFSMPLLVPDEASYKCLLCPTTFGVTSRRHHCRHCGLLVCES